MNIKQRIVEVRQIALRAECAAMEMSNMIEAVEFEKIGRKLDKILRAIDTEEKTKE